MKIRRGDVVLADYSHSLTGDSFRPVLVIQADGYNQSLTNTVVPQITTQHSNAPTIPLTSLIDVSTPEGKQAGLLHNSVVSCYNLNTVKRERVHRVVGAVSQGMMQKIDDCLKAALGLR